MDETFTLLPLVLDPSTKAISAPSLTSNSALTTELTLLNSTHRSLLTLDTPGAVPPPPLPLNPKRSAAIQKMREQGNASLSKKGGTASAANSQGHIQEAIKLYSYAVEMALTRPPWEPAGIVRDELAILLSNRAQAYMSLQQWPEGAADAESSVELKPTPGNGKAWWRRGKCLVEMGRWEEAGEWVKRGLEAAGEEGSELKPLGVEVEAHLARVRERAGR
ncbi:hypothetical protein MMC19_005526 [Ptychographa xylographoides]|nr:hypothetical protein [Ptychographa xylographoides]